MSAEPVDFAGVKSRHRYDPNDDACDWCDGYADWPCTPWRLADEVEQLTTRVTAVEQQRDQWRDAARKDWVDEVSARTMQFKDQIEELRERLEDAEGARGEAQVKVQAVEALLTRTCCQFDGGPRWTCRTALEHKRDWCMHCRVSAALTEERKQETPAEAFWRRERTRKFGERPEWVHP